MDPYFDLGYVIPRQKWAGKDDPGSAKCQLLGTSSTAFHDINAYRG